MGLVVVHSVQAIALLALAAWLYRRKRRMRAVGYLLVGIASIGLVWMDISTMRMKAEIARGLPPVISDPQNYALIHRPEAGCPPGFTEHPGVFERNGRESAGCVNPKKLDGPTDYLMPGESMHFILALPVPTDPDARPRI